NALEDVLHLTVGQRSLIRLLYRLQNLLFALRFINGKIGVVLQLADLSRCRSPLIDQLNDFEIHFIDFLTPVFYGHVVNAPVCAPEVSTRSHRTKLATGSAEFGPCLSMMVTMALPITAASANWPTA